MDFRTRLKEEISFSGLTNKEIAAKAGITKRAVDSYVSSQACMPAADVAVKLAKVLNTSVEYLITGIEIESPAKTEENARKLLHLYYTLSEKEKTLLLSVASDIEKILK